jgi:putative thioredoxin
VVERSRELPVVVDFWAEWCGPCKALTPILERAAAAREGKVELAKVDTDANPDIARAFGIQGIPNVKAFRGGEVVDEFVGVKPAAEVERFFDGLVPSEADTLAAGGDEASLRRAVELDPAHAGAAMALARLLLRRGDQDEAEELLGRFEGDFTALGLQARLQIQREGDDLAGAFAAWDDGDFETALEALQGALQGAAAERRDLIRRVMVAIFEELGPGHELAQAHRRRLASALY